MRKRVVLILKEKKQRIEDIKRKILQKNVKLDCNVHTIELKPKVISKLSINKQMIIRSLKEAYHGS